MTVRELKEKLKNENDDYDIILSSDAEGNSYSPLASVDFIYYKANNSFTDSFELFFVKWSIGFVNITKEVVFISSSFSVEGFCDA